MIRAISGPLVSAPLSWLLIFDREASTRLKSALAMGRYKHVRAAGYVPFLHVWVFFDPHWGGVDLFLAADGEPAQRVLAAWTATADVIRMNCQLGRPLGHQIIPPSCRAATPLLGFCVPLIKRLIGLRCGALRPDALWRHCLANGGEPFEASGHDAIQGALAVYSRQPA